MKLGKQLFSHWTGADIRPKKTQSENHCEHFNSIRRTPTKFVLFSNQKGKKIFSSLKLLGNSVHNKRSKAIVYDFVEKVCTISRYTINPNNPVVIFHSLSITSLTPECIHLGNPSTGRIDSPVNYGYLFT